jgi:hypothetical protein
MVGKNLSPYLKNARSYLKSKKDLGIMVQVVVNLPSKLEALNSNSTTANK